MYPILDDLFAALQSDRMSEAEARLIDQADRIIQEKLTVEQTDLLWQKITDWAEARRLDGFRQGFRLGMQLVLEGLSPAYPEARSTAAERAARPDPPR